MSERFCKTCIYGELENGSYGVCRRYPPAAVSSAGPNPKWPKVNADDFCGEWSEQVAA